MSVQEEQPIVDVSGIKKKATKFVAKEYETENYPLVKKNDIENKTFIVFQVSKVQDEDNRIYYNFKALDEHDEPFCFNGSNILYDQIDGNIPCYVKLVKKERDDKLRPYYWIFANPE